MKITQTDGDLVQRALHASVAADILGVKRIDGDTIAVVAMRIKDKGVTFGWKFTAEAAGLAKKYLYERDLLPFFPEHVSPEAKVEIKRDLKREDRDRKAEKRVEKMAEKNPELYFGMFTVRGNKAVARIVNKTPLGKDAEETYLSVIDGMENAELDCMYECMDTDVREHVWTAVLERHGEKPRNQRGPIRWRE